MLSLLRRTKLYNGRFSLVGSFSSSAANSPKPKLENANQDSFAATYLKSTYGFSPEKALAYSKYLSFDSSERPESLVAFFKNHHFTDSQISVIVRKWPMVFRYVPEISFRPKIEFLQSFGCSTSDMIKILTAGPQLLGRSLEGQIIPCVDFLRSFLCSDKDVLFSIMRYPGILKENLHDVLLPNIEILRGACVPGSHIAALLKINPRNIAIDPKRFKVTVEEVQKLGLNPGKKIFIDELFVMVQLSSSTWKEKINHFKRWGLSENQVLDAFRKHPRFMAASKDKISRIMDLFANNMASGLSILLSRPQIMSLSLEKTIAPRCAFYHVLLSKGLIKQDSSLAMMLECPQRLFLGRYVQRYTEEAPELLDLYQEILSTLKE